MSGLLHRLQRRRLQAVGPRVEEAAIGITPLAYFPALYEDMRLKE